MPLVCNQDATCVVSELRVRPSRRYFSEVAIYNIPFGQKHDSMYYCTVHNSNDIQQH